MIRPANKKFDKEAVFEQLKIDEGVEYEIYKDHLGYFTFGVGHLVTHEDPENGQDEGTPVSNERVWEAFECDLEMAISECKKLYAQDWDNFPAEIQEILVNMMFNMGRPRLGQFKKMNQNLSAGNWVAAAVEGRDSRWYNQVTNRAERLMVRMEAV